MPADVHPRGKGGGALAVSPEAATLAATPNPSALSVTQPVSIQHAPTLLASDPPPATSSAKSFARGDTIGRYVVLDRVGAGGMAVVYAAYDPKLDRRVALKLVHPDLGRSSGSHDSRARLLREAQAMARLSHPNVVPVFDTGTVDDEVFLAMEFVEGSTLDRWCAAKKRSWQEVLAVFVAAGRGLAAAHAAGLIHRDFKPGNVLVGLDGRVRVADFGLARAWQIPVAQGDARHETPSSSAPRDASARDDLTVPGGLLGTPAYMSLEQFTGQATDVRTDVFSYCLALYEAVYGERPFEGDTLLSLPKAIAEQRIRSAPPDSPVPAWLRTALLRGLKALPDERYPSMAPLLDELAKDRSGSLRAIVLGAFALVAAGAIALAVAGVVGRHAEQCGGGDARWSGVWDDAQRAAASRAFQDSGLPYATSAFASVDAALTAYGRTWTTMYRQSCEATRKRGEQSEELLDRRMACLDERLTAVRAWSALLTRADRGTVEHAVQAAQGLPEVEGCSDLAALMAVSPMPADRSKREQIDALRRKVAETDSLVLAGKAVAAAEPARRNADEGRALGYDPAAARALYALGQVENKLGHWQAAASALEQAAWAAEAGRDDDLLADAAIDALWLTGYRLGDAHAGRVWAGLADAAIRRRPDNPLRRARLAHAMGGLLSTEGHFEEAMDHYHRSVELATQATGAGSLDVAELALRVGQMHTNFAQYEAAEPYLQQAVDILTRVLGGEHPDLAAPLGALGETRAMLGRVEDGLQMIHRARELVVRSYGEDHTVLVDTDSRLAAALACAGRLDDAIEAARSSTRICKKNDGTDAPRCLQMDHDVGRMQLAAGRQDEAMRTHRDAYERAKRTLGDHPLTSLALWGMADVYLAQGRYAEAIEALKQTEGTTARHHKADSPHIGMALNTAGEALLGLGLHAEAKAAFEGGLPILEKAGVDAYEVGVARFGLARALQGQHGDRARIAELVRGAREAFGRVGLRGSRRLAELQAWWSKVATVPLDAASN